MKYLISFGLNQINPKYYGTDGKLSGCINDINDVSQWFKPDEWYYCENNEATTTAFINTMNYAANKAQAGDIVLVNYSGHGTQVLNKDAKEKDGIDEGFCFYDKILLDKTFSNLVAQFKEGVKVIALIDACHSGGLSREAIDPNLYKIKRLVLPYRTREVIKLNPIKCSYLGLLACGEDQSAMDGEKNGLFTETMLKNYKQGTDVLTWIKNASKKVTVQKFNYKTYGKSFAWKEFKL